MLPRALFEGAGERQKDRVRPGWQRSRQMHASLVWKKECDEWSSVLPPLVRIDRITFVGTSNRVDSDGSKGWITAL